MLVLRTCPPDGHTSNGFVWPLEVGATTQCPDPDPDPDRPCGGGLHGLPWGEGDGGLLNWNADVKWIVFEPNDESEVVGSPGKCRCWRRVTIRCVGTQQEATQFVLQHGGQGKAIVGRTATAGDWGTATAGYKGTATAGDWGTATAGELGTATAGYKGTATAGDWGTATAGDGGILQLRWWDAYSGRHRIVTAYVGENSIKAGVAYRLSKDHELVEVNAA